MSRQRFFALSLGLGALLLAAHHAFAARPPALAQILSAPARVHVPEWMAPR